MNEYIYIYILSSALLLLGNLFLFCAPLYISICTFLFWFPPFMLLFHLLWFSNKFDCRNVMRLELTLPENGVHYHSGGAPRTCIDPATPRHNQQLNRLPVGYEVQCCYLVFFRMSTHKRFSQVVVPNWNYFIFPTAVPGMDINIRLHNSLLIFHPKNSILKCT